MNIVGKDRKSAFFAGFRGGSPVFFGFVPVGGGIRHHSAIHFHRKPVRCISWLEVMNMMYACALRPDAEARIVGGADAPELTGEMVFYQKGERVFLSVWVKGLPEEKNGTGFFALHIHDGESCGGEGFSDTGGHYNPMEREHPRHAGDLPPLLSCGGEAYMAVLSDRFRVEEIVGKTVVIHSGADDFHSQPAGNAGTKIACGVIRAMNH